MAITRSSHTRSERRMVRHARLRARVGGRADRPRLTVFRSSRHVSAQLIDDAAGRTLCGLTDAHVTPELLRAAGDGNDRARGIARAFAVGKLLAERAQAQGIRAVVFDRGGFSYHGQVKAVADGARAGGLIF